MEKILYIIKYRIFFIFSLAILFVVYVRDFYNPFNVSMRNKSELK